MVLKNFLVNDRNDFMPEKGVASSACKNTDVRIQLVWIDVAEGRPEAPRQSQIYLGLLSWLGLDSLDIINDRTGR